MLIEPYAQSSKRFDARSGRFWTALISSGSARAAGASRHRLKQSGSRRMARTTWEPAGGRAAPWGRRGVNQRSPGMHELLPAGSVARRTVGTSFWALALLLVAACARTDLGAPCHLQDPQGAELRPQPGREYLYLGSSECESFACLATPGTQGSYCSQPCSETGGSCPAGLACGQLKLNQDYLDAMTQRLPSDRF